jgi:hypothetical protein
MRSMGQVALFKTSSKYMLELNKLRTVFYWLSCNGTPCVSPVCLLLSRICYGPRGFGYEDEATKVKKGSVGRSVAGIVIPACCPHPCSQLLRMSVPAQEHEWERNPRESLQTDIQ